MLGVERLAITPGPRAGYAGDPGSVLPGTMSLLVDERLLTTFSAVGWKRFIAALELYRNRGKALPSSVTLLDATAEERRSY